MTDSSESVPASVNARYRRYALGVLLVIYTLNFLDRQIMNTLAEPIKRELALSDTQLGLMTGLAFALFYTVLGIPIARLAERANRPYIIAGAIAVWSGFTVLCGYAQNFVQMVLARIGVGVGEAGCTPAAHSLISDYVPKEKRASAMAFYSLGTPLGSLLGMIMGGVIADLWGWRTAFLIAGVPGILLALVAASTLIEPRRRQAMQAAAARPKGPTFADALKELRSKRTFWFVALAASLKAFVGYGSAAFIVSFFLRNHIAEITALAASYNMKPLGFTTTFLGLIGGIAALFGTWFGGWLSDRYGNRDLRFNMGMPALATLVAIPFSIGGLMAGNMVLAAILLTIPSILSSLWYGPVYSTAQGLVRPETRATASAVLLFIINLIGLGLGPLGIGILSDFFSKQMGYGENEGLRWALVVFYAFGLLAFVFFWLARRTIREETVS